MSRSIRFAEDCLVYPLSGGLGALVLILSLLPQPVMAGDGQPKIDPALRYALEQADDTATIRVIVTATPGKFNVVRSRLLGTGNGISQEHRFVEALSARLRRADVLTLAADAAVAHVSLDHVVRSTAAPAAGGPPSPPSTPNSQRAMNDTLLSTLGLVDSPMTGKGVGVAVLDSGLQPSTDLPASAFRDFVSNTGTVAYDDYGHGTHVSGLIRASASSGNPRAGNGVVGIAPAVRLVSMKVLDGSGQGYTSTVLSALESVLTNRGSLGIDVVNLSLGHPITEPAAVDPLVQAVEALSRKGLIVVVAAGNWGRNPSTGLAAYTGITSPGNAPSALTVGAFDNNQTAIRGDDQVAAYSSRGPSWYDGLAKPDLVAPGHDLSSLAAIGSSLFTRFPDHQVLDATGAPRFMRLSGTSMATAVTSGVVALLIETNRVVSRVPLTPNAVKGLLQFTAIPIAGSDLLTQGAGALNPAGALSVVGVLTGLADSTRRSTTVVQPVTVIDAEINVWNQAIVWGHTLVSGDTVYANEPAWGSQITWGTAVVWGHGNPAPGDLVWDQAALWSANTIWDPIVAPASVGSPWLEIDAHAIVWGHGGPY